MKMLEGMNRVKSGQKRSYSSATRFWHRARLLRLLLALSLLLGLLPTPMTRAHEPIIYGPDGSPLVVDSQTDQVSPMRS